MNRLLALVVVVCLQLLSGSAHATITLSRFPPNPGVLPGGGWQFTSGSTFGNPVGARAWVNGVYGSVPKWIASDAMVLAGRAGALPVTAASSVGLADGAAAIARCVIGGGVICAAGSAAAIAYAAYRIKRPDQVPGSVVGPGSLDYDPGQAPGTILTEVWDCPQGDPEACIAVAWPPGTSMLPDFAYERDAAVCTATGPNSVRCQPRAHPLSGGASLNWGAPIDYHRSSQSVPGCTESIDALNPQYSIPAGGTVGPDGQCPTARYNHVPVSAEGAAAPVVNNPPSFPSSTWRDALRDSIDTGGQSVPATVGSSGPASQTGTPTTTTTTSGGQTTTTTSTPTYTYNYGGDTITYNTTVTTVVNNNGVETTTTTNEGGAAPQDPKDPCTANPQRAGCTDLGTPPTDAPAWETKTIVWETDSLGLPSGCPPAHVITIRDWPLTLNYGPACDIAPTVRAALLALTALGCALLIIKTVQT